MDSISKPACINCGNEVHGSFCPTCGQRTPVRRMSFKDGWFDFWSRLYGFDGMFPRTLRDLTLRPGFVAHEFIRGIRIKYYGPVGYFFLIATLLLLFLSSINLSFGELVEETRKSLPKEENTAASQWIVGFVTNNVKLVLFLGIPFQGLAARYFFFRKSGYRLIEHMVLPFYLTGHLLWITMIFALAKALFDTSIPTFTPIFSFLFYGFGYMTLMIHQSKVKTFLKGMGIYLTGQILFMIFIVLAAIVGIIWISFFDPETFNLIRPSNNK